MSSILSEIKIATSHVIYLFLFLLVMIESYKVAIICNFISKLKRFWYSLLCYLIKKFASTYD